MGEPQLRLTRRALDDLELDVEAFCRLPANLYADEHEVVRAFVDMRSQSVNGQEVTILPRTSLAPYNLHHGRYRGLTWHDEDLGVCWLLGVGWHEHGSVDDAYAVLKRRDLAGELMPSVEDYRDLIPDTRSFLIQLQEAAALATREARQAPGQEVRVDVAGVVDLAIHIEVIGEADELVVEEVTICLLMPPKRAGLVTTAHLSVVMAAALPHANPDEIEWPPCFPGREDDPSYLMVARWCGDRT